MYILLLLMWVFNASYLKIIYYLNKGLEFIQENYMESFSESKILAKVAAGFKGGNSFKNPLTPQKMTFVEGYPSEALDKVQLRKPVPSMPITDSWNQRRSK